MYVQVATNAAAAGTVAENAELTARTPGMAGNPAAITWRGLRSLLALTIAMVWSQVSWANHNDVDPPATCPTLNITAEEVGDPVVLNDVCDTRFGIGFSLVSLPAHGTATILDAGSTSDPSIISYQHFDTFSPATTDSFSYDDGSGRAVVVNVTIVPGTPSLQIDTNASLPVAYAGESYSQHLTASGGTGSYTWSLVSGTLPAGFSLSAGGLISGVTTHRQNDFLFEVQVSDGTLSGSKQFTLDVDGAPMTLAPNPAPDAFVNHPYSVTFTTDGGVAPRTLAVNSGSSLPPGLSLSGHTLSGSPTAVGSYTFQLIIGDASTGTGTNWELVDVTMNVNPQPTITVAPATLPDAVVGDAYDQTVSASGGTAPYTFAVTAGSLPAGLTLNASTGQISGTPTAGGSASFTVTATDDNGFPGQLAYTLEVLTPPSIVTFASDVSCFGYTNGVAVVAVASGGTAPFAYSWAPSGGTGTTAGGLAPGTYTVTVTDANGLSDTASVTIGEPAALAVSPPSLPGGRVGTAYSEKLTASGGTGIKNFTPNGTLPAGLTMAGDGTVSGTPTAPGTSNFSVQVTDQNTCSLIESYSITIDPAIPVAGNVNATVGYGSGANPITLDLSGGVATSVAVATPPANGTAIASGTLISYQPDPGYAGPDSFTYTASNAGGTSAPATVSITVSDPVITVTASAGWTARIGESYSQTFTWSGGAAPYSGYVVTGLPAGLAVTASDTDSVTVSGTPTETGTFTVTATATDASTGTGPFTRADSFTLQVDPPANFVLSPTGIALTSDYLQLYSQAFSASGGTEPYTYTLTGALPAGLSFDGNTGVLSGTPTETGLFLFTVAVTDSSTGTAGPNSRQRDYLLDVGDNISLTPLALADGNVGAAYLQTLSASGGAAPYTFSMNGTPLPPGLALDPDGTVHGTPTTPGNYMFNIRATDDNGVAGSHGYLVTIAPATLTVTPAALPAATVDTVYSETITASGGVPPYQYVISAGALPLGFSLDADSGVLSGSTSTTGTYNFDVLVTDSGGGTAATETVNYTLVIDAPEITIGPANLPAGTVGNAYGHTLTASGGTAPYSFALSSGALPAGLTLSSAGVLSGTPSLPGTSSFAVTATDSSGGSGPYSGTATYSLTITAIAPVAGDVSAAVPYGSGPTAITLDISGGSAVSVAVAGAPAHGSTSVSGLSISYQPDAGYAGPDSFTYTASNVAGTSAPATVSILVEPPALTLSPAAGTLSLDYAAPFSQIFTASGGTGPYSYALTGPLPAGLSFDTNSGVLSGIPAEEGSFAITITATDSSTGTDAPFSVAASYALEVGTAAIVLTPVSIPAGTVHDAYSLTFSASGGIAPYQYAVVSGALPGGLILDANTGVLSGTPTTAGTFAFEVQVTDNGDPAASATAAFSLTIDAVTAAPKPIPGLDLLGLLLLTLAIPVVAWHYRRNRLE